ncbi:hypothetical protein BD779DRAFT_1497903 [Infundibulicybe gibba]|nr:hypothetical protein BD779DRAFT_1497903 [Infundibulicybe gibba]
MPKLVHVFSTLVLLLGTVQSLAAPNPQESSPPLLHCDDGVHTCPPGWACCGPITFAADGGTCHPSGEGQVCPL